MLLLGSVLATSLLLASAPPRAARPEMAMAAHLHEPASRNEHYKDNLAQYLVDLHDAKATFDFCGGMMFQVRL